MFKKFYLIWIVLLFGARVCANYWTITGDMDTPRANLTATVLDDGKVLAAGGQRVL